MPKAQIKRAIITGGLEVAHVLSLLGLMPGARGRGAIFTLHHVRPQGGPSGAGAINSNRHLEITPDFLEAAILRLKRDGYRLVRLEDVPALLAERESGGPFAAFTLDDGFRDNLQHALPVFERHAVPFTVFVCKGFSERTHTLWWETLDALINRAAGLSFDCGDGVRTFDLSTAAGKWRAAVAIGGAITRPGEAEAIERLNALARENGIDPAALAAELVLDRDGLADLARHPLASLGAHTVSHRALALLAASELKNEIEQSIDYVAAITGRRPACFAYPYGDGRSVSAETENALRDAGLYVGVTTRPATLSGADAARPQALPRISLNGYFQKPRHVAALASGIPFKLMGG